MKFDVIIGNPPYQLSTGGGQAQAMPLYHRFVQQAKKLNPRYLCMITPSRYFAGGIGLSDFRREMLNDKRIRVIVDFLQSDVCFPGVVIAGGVNYFLWERDNPGLCHYTVHDKDIVSTAIRDLSEYEVFIRSNVGLGIIEKVRAKEEKPISVIMSSLSPFGLNSYERGHNNIASNDYKMLSSDGYAYIDSVKVSKGYDFINSYKVAISYATSGSAASVDKEGKRKVLAKLILLKPKEVCTFTYFLAGPFSDAKEAQNCLDYLATKFSRFLLFLSLTSIHVSKDKYRFVPIQDFSNKWTDEELYKKYNLSSEEIAFIDSMIKPMDLNGGEDNA